MIFSCPGISLNAFTVLPAWRLEAVQGQESTHILHSCADRYRFRPTLLLLPHFLRGWGQSAGKTVTHAHKHTKGRVQSWTELSFNIFLYVRATFCAVIRTLNHLLYLSDSLWSFSLSQEVGAYPKIHCWWSFRGLKQTITVFISLTVQSKRKHR